MILAYQWYKRNKARKAEEAASKAEVDGAAGVPVEPSTTTITGDGNRIVSTATADSVEGVSGAEKVPAVTDGALTPAAVPKKTKHIETAEAKAEKKRRRIYRWKLVLALFPCAFLASVDLTVVSTALTTIASDFNKLDQFNWIVTAYTLTSTAFIPTYGQLSDVFGRHTALQISMFFMVLGSTLCAAAQTWTMLLFGRAFQGLSAAGIMNMIKIILADKVTLAEQSKNQTIFALVSGISYSVGPIIGGSLANSNWRFCFVVSIPVAVLSHVFIFVFLRKELLKGSHSLTGPNRKSVWSGLATIDYGGTLLFIFGVGLLILGTSWGGSTYPWTDVKVLAPLIIGAIMFTLFFVWEYLLEPGRIVASLFPRTVAMIPWSLFQRRDVISLAFINAAAGAAMYSAFYFVGIFWTLVQDYDPAKAGYQLLYYLPGIGVGVYSAMALLNFWPRQTFYPIFVGTVLEMVGFAVLAWATKTRNNTVVSVMMAIAGAGTGVRFMPIGLHATGVWPRRVASVYSLMDFALPFGGTLGIAIMSAVFYNKFSDALIADAAGSAVPVNTHNTTQSLQGINGLPPQLQDVVRDQAATAVMWSFISIMPVMGLSVLGALVLGNVWIKPKKTSSEAEARGQVIYSSFLIALITGTVKAKKVPIDRREGVDVEEEKKEGEILPREGTMDAAQVA